MNEFIQLSRLPTGSVRLKSYTGRAFFGGLFSAPAERKRAGILDVLDSFPDSKFLLVGDSGEQDLELYATLARDRPGQVLAIFIRDASNSEVVKPLDDPTGEQVLRCSADEVPVISPNSRNPLSVIIPKAGSATSTPSTSPKLGDTNFTPRRRPSKSISEMSTPRASASRYIAPLRRPSRTQSEQVLLSDTVPISVRRSSGSGNSSSDSSGSSSVGLPPPYAGSISSSLGSQSSCATPLSDSPISEEPADGANPDTSAVPIVTLVAPTASRPIPISRPSSYFTRTPSRSSTLSSMIGVGGAPAMTDAEKKQFDLQTRVYRARLEVPRHIPLRVFRSPEECVEAEGILDHLHFGSAGDAQSEAKTVIEVAQ